jgi:transcriptional regulator with XRE-family HTH domain
MKRRRGPVVRTGRGGRRELSEFLRTRRARLAPEVVGLAPGRRRSPGLRREEVAAGAGVGLSWYTRFEQGKPIQVSAAFLENLARTLQLSDAERTQLFVLAQHRPPPLRARIRVTNANKTLQAMLDVISCPAYARNRRFDVVAWNAANTRMFGDFARIPPAERNVLWLLFARGYHRLAMPSWESDARAVLAKFRMNYAEAAGDSGFEELVSRLNEASADFRRLWKEHAVSSLGEGVTRFTAPRHGRQLQFRHHLLMPEAFPDLRITIYVPLEPKSAG